MNLLGGTAYTRDELAEVRFEEVEGFPDAFDIDGSGGFLLRRGFSRRERRRLLNRPIRRSEPASDPFQ
jgi:hypothetical protein